MRIFLIDTNQRKFTQDMIDYWRAYGHEVKYMHTCHRPHMEWADLIWFDCVDGNLICATKKIPEAIEGKLIVARAIDIDVWANHFNAVDWSRVDHLIFIAKHIQDYMLKEKRIFERIKWERIPQIYLIPCGVNLDKFTLKRDLDLTKDIAVVMRLWYGKGLDLLLQVIAALPECHFHICGRWSLNGIEQGWYRRYIDQFLSYYTNWSHTDHVADMNEWLEDKSYTLLCSKKEAFSFAGHEGAAKGLRPLIHEFYGARGIWPSKFIWRTIEDVVRMVRDPEYRPSEYRRYVVDTYSLDRMLDEFDKIIAEKVVTA